MAPRLTDEEDEEQFPALHRSDRQRHLRRMARNMTPDASRSIRLVGLQYFLLAALVVMLLLYGSRLRLRLPRQMWWLVVIYLGGGAMLVWGRHRNPPS